MLRLPPFRYLAPSSLDEAARMLASEGPDAMPVAGGTDLYPNMKRRQFTPGVLVGIGHLSELAHIEGSPESGLRIGAGVSLTTIAEHPQIRASYPALALAAVSISTPQLRNMGTIGGNVLLDTRCNYYNQTEFWRHSIGYCMKRDGDICLVAPGSPRCWAIASADTAPVLLSLDARVTLVSAHGTRQLPIRDLYRDDGMRPYTREPDELLTEIALPSAQGWQSTYLKLRRRGSFDFPLLGVAVALLRDEEGTILDARLALGAVASHPVEADDAAALLRNQRLDAELIEQVAQVATKRARPLDNADLTINYRKQVTPIYIKRALTQLLTI
ncbi:FAD binding domain-containing protein [Ktedonospora formicarum]|uniref:Oxidoreductase n=1 Tax=Ktedonospora formicarum TaxID=2778364 RepID=A0A8J3I4B9_9CHLR|nr:xanthine dehydrogenase family protein subunit M [Ktedonospora formicarum]GHO46718.1 oxidoreductase [Ktedonospora formicarum]